MNPYFKHRKKFFFFPLIAAAFIFAGSFVVMLLWNAILPSVITGFHPVTYLQAVGLLILCRILFGGLKGRGASYRNGSPWKEKMMNMSEEDREKFKAQWKERCGRR